MLYRVQNTIIHKITFSFQFKVRVLFHFKQFRLRILRFEIPASSSPAEARQVNCPPPESLKNERRRETG